METINTTLDALDIVLRSASLHNLTNIEIDDLLDSLTQLSRNEKYKPLFVNYFNEFGMISRKKLLITLKDRGIINNENIDKKFQISFMNNSKNLLQNLDETSLSLINEFMTKFRRNIEKKYMKLDAIEILLTYSKFFKFENITFQQLSECLTTMYEDERYQMMFMNYIDQNGNIEYRKIAAILANKGALNKEKVLFPRSQETKLLNLNYEVMSFLNSFRKLIENQALENIHYTKAKAKVNF